MPTNVEVKASVQDLKTFLGNAKLLSGSDGTCKIHRISQTTCTY